MRFVFSITPGPTAEAGGQVVGAVAGQGGLVTYALKDGSTVVVPSSHAIELFYESRMPKKDGSIAFYSTEITPLGKVEPGAKMFDAWNHSYREIRSYRYDKIQKAIVTSSGQTLTGAQLQVLLSSNLGLENADKSSDHA